MDTLHIAPLTPFRANLTVPGDKSISHRALILASIAKGESCLHNVLWAEDTKNLVTVLTQLGIHISNYANRVRVQGNSTYTTPLDALDFGNSGTGMRLMAGVLAGQSIRAVLTGDSSLLARPMGRITGPLRLMGADIHGRDKSSIQLAPLHVYPSKLKSIHYTLPVPSAQVKSAVLLAGLFAQGGVTVNDPFDTRDHTENMLQQFGANITKQSNTICLHSNYTRLVAQDIHIPGDFSQAAFFIVLATILPGCQLTIKNVGINPTRTGLLHILDLMGADIQMTNQRQLDLEPIADIQVKSAKLVGVNVPEKFVTQAIDEFPILFIAACYAKGKTSFSGLSELRVKESDRIAAMCQALSKMGIRVEEQSAGVKIHGGAIQPAEVEAADDHRVAMALAIAYLAAQKHGGVIRQAGKINTSFPDFLQKITELDLV